MFKIKTKYNKGFAMLYASLIGGLVFAIGLAILNVTIKQITLASAGRESQKAFYAADSGTECALYLNTGGGNPDCSSGVFKSDNQGICGVDYKNTPVYNYKCSGKTVSFPADQSDNIPFPDDAASSPTPYSTNFLVNTTGDPGICFHVYVTKYIYNGSGGGQKTRIDSRGYSTCDESTGINRFERAIRTTF